MALIYITGAPGSGKSTIQKALSTHGVETHDIDDPDLGGPHNKLTGKLVTIPAAEERSESWFDDHEWRIYRSALDELKNRSKDKNIVICGVSESDEEILDIFNKVIYLSIDNEHLKERLRERNDNDYGKNEFELQEILKRKKKLDTKYLSTDTVKIDASLPLQQVVDDILAYVS